MTNARQEAKMIILKIVLQTEFIFIDTFLFIYTLYGYGWIIILYIF